MEPYKEEFRAWLKLKGLSDISIKNYEFYLDKFCLFETFNQATTELFISKYNQTIARAFIKNYKEFLISRYKQEGCMPEEISKLNDISLPKLTGRRKARIPDVLNRNQAKKIVRNLPSEEYKLMFWITFYGGLRLAGLMGIKVDSFQWDLWYQNKEEDCELKVIEKGDKQRTVFIPPKIIDRLVKWLTTVRLKRDDDKTKPIFQQDRRKWQKMLVRISNEQLGFKTTPHTLRHSCATYLLKKGLNVKELQEYLGHESLSSTEIYLHINPEELKEKIKNIRLKDTKEDNKTK